MYRLAIGIVLVAIASTALLIITQLICDRAMLGEWAERARWLEIGTVSNEDLAIGRPSWETWTADIRFRRERAPGLLWPKHSLAWALSHREQLLTAVAAQAVGLALGAALGIVCVRRGFSLDTRPAGGAGWTTTWARATMFMCSLFGPVVSAAAWFVSAPRGKQFVTTAFAVHISTQPLIIWACYAMAISFAASRATESRLLFRRNALAGLCCHCGYPRTASLLKCSECGRNFEFHSLSWRPFARQTLTIWFVCVGFASLGFVGIYLADRMAVPDSVRRRVDWLCMRDVAANPGRLQILRVNASDEILLSWPDQLVHTKAVLVPRPDPARDGSVPLAVVVAIRHFEVNSVNAPFGEAVRNEVRVYRFPTGEANRLPIRVGRHLVTLRDPLGDRPSLSRSIGFRRLVNYETSELVSVERYAHGTLGYPSLLLDELIASAFNEEVLDETRADLVVDVASELKPGVEVIRPPQNELPPPP